MDRMPLGTIICPDGTILEFGEYEPYIKRITDNPEHFHDTAFRNLKNKNIFFPFINNNDDTFSIIQNIPLFAKNHYIVLLNSTNGTFEITTPMLIIGISEDVTDVQKRALLSIEDYLHFFDNGIMSINVINKSEDIIREYHDLEIFFNDYLEIDYKSTLNKKKMLLLKRH